jgi:hypothetical protein
VGDLRGARARFESGHCVVEERKGNRCKRALFPMPFRPRSALKQTSILKQGWESGRLPALIGDNQLLRNQLHIDKDIDDLLLLRESGRIEVPHANRRVPERDLKRAGTG